MVGQPRHLGSLGIFGRLAKFNYCPKTSFVCACILLRAWLVLLATGLLHASAPMGAKELTGNFLARIIAVAFEPGVRVPRETESLITGTVFGDGFHAVLPDAGHQSGKPREQLARLGETLYSLQYSPENPEVFRAILEAGIAPRFLSPAMQVVALCFAQESDLIGLEQGEKRIILTLGQPFPEYFNTYRVDWSGMPREFHLVARAPGFAVGDRGTTPLPAPYTSGFTYWTLTVTSSDGRPNRGVFRRFMPSEDAVVAAQQGKNVSLVEIEELRMEVEFSWNQSAPVPGRLPAPPQVPFWIHDHRRIFDIYTNNRVSLAVEGAPLLRCTNAAWSLPEETARRAAAFVQRGLAERDALMRPWRKVILVSMFIIFGLFAGLILGIKWLRKN